MIKVKYFVGDDLYAIRTINKAKARGCGIAIQKNRSTIKIFVIDENLSIPEDHLKPSLDTVVNEHRPTYIETESTVEMVVKVLSTLFELEKVS